MPTGSPVSAATSSTKSSIESTSWKAVCRLGEAQSTPGSMPRISAISWVTLAPGSMPPRPGLAPCDSLISIAFTGAPAHRSLRRASSNSPRSSRHPKYDVPIWKTRSPPLRWYGDRAPSPVSCRQPANWAPAVERLDGVLRQRAEAHPGDVHDAGGAERVPSTSRPAQHLGRRQGHLVARVPGGRCTLALERAVLEDRVAVGVLDVVVGAEAEVVVLELGGRVDPAALVAAEGPLLVVARDDVLPQLGAEALQEEAEVADDRVGAEDGVPLLRHVARRDDGRGADRQSGGLGQLRCRGHGLVSRPADVPCR